MQERGGKRQISKTNRLGRIADSKTVERFTFAAAWSSQPAEVEALKGCKGMEAAA